MSCNRTFRKAFKSFPIEVPYRSRPVCRTGVCAGATLIFGKIKQMVLSGDILRVPLATNADTRRLLLEGQRHLQRKARLPKEEGEVCYEKTSLWQTPAPCDRLGVCVSVAPASHPRCKKQRIISGKTECGYDFGPRPETLRNGSVFSRSLRWSLRYSGSQGIRTGAAIPPPPPPSGIQQCRESGGTPWHPRSQSVPHRKREKSVDC